MMLRRTFIKVSAAAAAVLPSLLKPESYDCSCGLVTYWKQPEGHFAAQYFAGQRFTYALWRQHEYLHRKMAAETNV